MSDTFFEKSKDIANDFIQSIVFLDDRAYKGTDQENPNHDFDALKISQAFASESKICAVYKPESDSDINNFKLIADKADIIILDWQIVFQQEIKPGSEEEDAPDDPRGIYTKDVIKSVLFDEDKSKNSLKLVIVYTGDYTLLENIAEEIYKDVFNSSENYNLDKNDFSINSSEVKILIRAKKVEIGNVGNKEKYEKKMIGYEDLPSFVLNEFTLMTAGLLCNFALASLSTLRKNSSKIVGLFSKEMDSAYLSHKALLPNQEDAEDLLVELFADTISDLLFYNKLNSITRNLIEDWVKGHILEEDQELFNKKGESYNPIEKYKRTQDLLIGLLNSSDKNVLKRYKDVFNSVVKTSKGRIDEYFELLSLNNTLLFLNEDEQQNKKEIDQKFSILTHHKSLFIPNNTIPKLTLGTVVKSSINENNYFICIQQKCDSVRIPKTNERKFLFIPLTVSTEKFDILTPDGIKLKRNKDSFSIRTIKFICSNDYGVVLAEKNEDDVYMFKQIYNTATDEHFLWIFDLKDLHSQRMIAEYTSQLSRVGLNESEWHRKQLS